MKDLKVLSQQEFEELCQLSVPSETIDANFQKEVAAIEAEYATFINEVEKFQHAYINWVKERIIPQNSKFALSGGLLYYSGKTKFSPVSRESYTALFELIKSDIKESAVNLYRAPRSPQDISQIAYWGNNILSKFLLAFNTLQKLIDAANSFCKQDIDVLLAKQQQERIEMSQKRSSSEDRRLKLIEMLKNTLKLSAKCSWINGESFSTGIGENVLLGFALYMHKNIVQGAMEDIRKAVQEDGEQDINLRYPVFLPVRSGKNTLVFNCSSELMENNAVLDEFVQRYVISFLKSFPAGALKIVGIEGNLSSFNIANRQAPVSKFLNKTIINAMQVEGDKSIVPISKQLMYDRGLVTELNDVDSVNVLLTKLNDLIETRKNRYFDNEDIFDYNRRNVDNQDSFVLIIINNFPSLFDMEKSRMLINVLNNTKYGIFAMVFQSERRSDYFTKSYNDMEVEECLRLSSENISTALFFDDIDNTSKTMRLQDVQLSYKIESPTYSFKDDWQLLGKQLRTGNIYKFSSLMEEANRSQIYKFNSEKLCAPIGKTDKVFDFITDMTSQPSALLLAGTGGGKTSFLHTLIFSLATTYSPNEVEIYIADYKSKDESAEFGLYQKGEKLYLPHIKFLSLKSSVENAWDMINKLQDLHDSRMKQIRKGHAADIYKYNNCDEVKSGKLPQMSRIVFIIDECNSMFGLDSGSFSGDKTLDKEVARLMKLFRSSGICLLLSGQSINGMKNCVDSIGMKIVLNMNQTWPNLKGWPDGMNISYAGDSSGVTEEKLVKIYEKGYALIKADTKAPVELVRLAYTGPTGGSEQLRLAEGIRQKYADYIASGKAEQVIANHTNAIPIDSERNLDGAIAHDIDRKRSKGLLSMYMGRGCTSDIAIPVSFEYSASNYYILSTDEDKALRITENLVLSFVKNTALLEHRYEDSRVVFVKVNNRARINITAYKQNYAEVDRCIELVTDPDNAAEQVMKFNDLFYQRNVSQSEIGEFAPYLLVIFGKQWRELRRTAFTVTESKVVEKPAETEKLDDSYEKIAADEKEMHEAGFDDEDIEMMLGYRKQMLESALQPIKEMQETTKQITLSAFDNALKNLVCYGHSVGIYVVMVGFGDEETVKTEAYFRSCDIKLNTRCVLGDFAKDSGESSDCCYINSFRYGENGERIEIGGKVRMFDYSGDNGKVWFKTLCNQLLK